METAEGDGLDDSHHGSDDAFAVVDGVHHLGYAVSLRFRREVLHEEDDDQGAQYGYENDRVAPWSGRRVLGRVIPD